VQHNRKSWTRWSLPNGLFAHDIRFLIARFAVAAPPHADQQKGVSMRKLIRSQLLTSTLLVGLATVAPAQAQGADQGATTSASRDSKAAGDEIVVTGTRLGRSDLTASSPVTVVSGETIRSSGSTGVEEFLRDLPQAVAAIGGNSNNGNPGVATVDLRNLGEARTLVLVDGRRFVPFDANGVVDLNMIPTSLVQRVEVLTGGASTVYGSDAIAGVVNFILKRDFQGFEADGQLGLSQRGDGFERAFSVTAGVSAPDGRGNIVVNAGYVKVDAVTQGARAFSSTVLAPETLGAGGGSSTNASGTIRGIPGPSCRGGSTAGVCTFDASGNLVPYVATRDGFNFSPYNLLLAPQDKWTATALARYDITDGVEFFGRASFANSRVTTIIAPSGTFNFLFDINYRTNPNLTAQARGVLAGADADGDGIVRLALGRRTVELGTRNSIFENTAYQLVGGFRGNIAEGLRYEIFGQWGRTSRTQTFANDISFARTQAGLLDGSVNLFGPGKLTAAAGQKIRLDLQEYDTTSQFVAGGFLAYDLPFTLGGSKNGGVVLGAEYRQDHARANPDENLIQGNAPGFGSSSPIDAKLDIKEVYGELKLPFFDLFSVEAGLRYANYKNRDTLLGRGNSFNTTSFKIGGDFQPIPDIRLRAIYQRSVRAPNLAEIGTPKTPAVGGLDIDPCASSQISAAAYAAGGPLAQLCLATGVPRAAALAGVVGDPISGQINSYVGGEIGLTPEKSDTLTAGVVLQPRFLSGFTATIDYFNIKVKNAIGTLPEADTIASCYNVEKMATGFFCSRIFRNPVDGSLSGGTETGVDSRFTNTGLVRTQGLDINLAYRTNLSDSVKLSLAMNATRIFKSQFQSATTTPIRDCVGLVGQFCQRPQPKWQFTQVSSLGYGAATFQVRWRYIGALKNDSLGFADIPDRTLATPFIGAKSYFDFNASFQAGEHFQFRLGMTNMFDIKPPVVGNGYGTTTENSGNTYPATYDPLGRSFFAGVNVKF
jgi:iron complex outermembrane recepter protein